MFQVGLVALAATGLVGCKAIRNARMCRTCSLASDGGSYVVGDAVSSGYVDAGYVDGGIADGGCTTCQKSPTLVDSPTFEGDLDVADSLEPLVLPMPDGSHESYSIQPEEQPVTSEPKPEPAVKPVPVETPAAPTMPPVVPPVAPPVKAPTTTTTNKPAAIDVDLKSSMSISMVGQDVVFEVSVANPGGSAIDSVDLVMNFSEGLRPKGISPEGVARVEGQRVVFEPIRSFAPMTLTYRVTAQAMDGMPEARASVEVTSPILTSGPIKRETVVRITP
jgi:hypothetical protein